MENKCRYQGVCLLALALFIALAIIGFSMCVVEAQEICKTPVASQGECVPIAKCTNVMHQLNISAQFGIPLPETFITYLQKSQCNLGATNGPYVCCEADLVDRDGEDPVTKKPTQQIPISTSGPRIEVKNDVDSLTDVGLQILLSTQCGNSSEIRVSGGEEASLSEFPWMALLKYNTDDQPFRCGGSLITNRYVLTAAHCFPSDYKVIGVRLGEHDLNTPIDCERRGRKQHCAPKPEDYGIEKAIVHPRYSRTQLVNDVALIKLDRVVNFDTHITPICLPVTKEAANLENLLELMIAGWGTTEKGEPSNLLMKAVIKNKGIETCQKIWSLITFSDNHLCVGGENGIDTCKGDSGGPLFFKRIYKTVPVYIQYGVVSFGYAHCGTNLTYPGVYASVVHHLPWITANID